MSPEIGISKVAALAIWQERLGHLLGLEKLAWNSLLPEYDPWKYGSFALNAAIQAYQITQEIQRQITEQAKAGNLDRFPPILAFQSVVDSTVTAPALVHNIFDRLPAIPLKRANRHQVNHELVLFDINRYSEIDPLMKENPSAWIDPMIKSDNPKFLLTLLSNKSSDQPHVIAFSRRSGSSKVEECDIGLSWPDDVYSLAHVALPFPPDDPVYGGDKAGLTDGDIQYQANGKITNGGLSKVVLNYELQAANLDFSVDQSKVSFRGPLKFSGIPLTLDWTTFLSGSDRGHANFTVDAPNVTGTQISALGYDVNEYVQGSVAVKSSAKLAPGGLITATIKSDFNNAELEIPQIHWHKATGEGGNVDFSLSIEKDHLHAEDINIELGKLKTSGDVQFDMAGPVMSLSLEQLSLSYAQLKGLKLERNEAKNLIFTLQGGEASLEPYLSGSDQVIDPQEKQVAAESEAFGEQLKSYGIVLEIGKSKLDKVYLNKNTYFDDIQFSGRWDNLGSHELNLSGHNPFGGSRIDTNVQPAATEKA